jgi:hypothetical protein
MAQYRWRRREEGGFTSDVRRSVVLRALALFACLTSAPLLRLIQCRLPFGSHLKI